MQEKTNMVADNSARLGLTINKAKSKVFRTMHQTTHPSQSKARHWRRWTASPISAAFWTTKEERMLMSEPASVKHEQPSIS
ncbi:hypothetical protein DPMN_088368 [Dreissena polymorpha]|uniref:Uncharacterized protein n=1 Tax=Dreissena polymorpha TaxID=45954 RepID=A0A9D4QWG1_DREPO|nr:hypothetical protein DPMN_088368 [Dreissena polymorpha]